VTATAYAAALAFAAESQARAAKTLRDAEEGRYRLLARSISDVISRHSRNGAIRFISPAAEMMLGAPAADLLGTACLTAFTSPIVRPISPRCPMPRAVTRSAASSSASGANPGRGERRQRTSSGWRCAAARSTRRRSRLRSRVSRSSR